MKKIISFALTVAILAMNSVYALSLATGTFNDYYSFDFYYDAIEFLAEQGVVQGYADGTYGYNDLINRAEFMKILIETKYLGQNTEFLNSYTDEGCFTDVEADRWYTGYVCYGEAMGWVNGYPDGSFRPSANINFVEAVKIVLNTLDVDYVDFDRGNWFQGMVEAASDSGFIPMTITAFNQDITRAEMADMIARKIKADGGELEVFLGARVNYNVTYDGIDAGHDFHKQWIDDNYALVHNDEVKNPEIELDLPVDVLTITSVDSDIFALTINIDGPALVVNDLYHVECLEDGKTHVSAKTLNTTNKFVTFSGLRSDTVYNCWAAIIDSGGNQKMTTNIKPYSTLGDFEKVQIIESSVTHESITLRVAKMELDGGEKYFAECVEVGSSDIFFPELVSSSTTLVLKGGAGEVDVKPDTEYSCYAAVSPSTGQNKFFSNSVTLTTEEPKLDVISFEVFADYVRFEIEPVNLNAGEYFYAQCLKDGNASPYGNPHDSGNDTTFKVFGLKGLVEYECTVEVRGSADPDQQPSEKLGFKTDNNPNQLPLTTAYTDVDNLGVYIVLGTTANVPNGETYLYSCSADDDSEMVMEVSTEKEHTLRLRQVATSYECFVAIGNEFASTDGSEHLWLQTP